MLKRCLPLFLLSITASALVFSCSDRSNQTADNQNIQVNAASVSDQPPTRIILMIADGIGFNGWLAADYYQGKAGNQSYQNFSKEGVETAVLGLSHGALNLVDANGNVLPRGADIAMASGAVEQSYDPNTRWDAFENAMINDFSPAGSYTTYTDSAAAGTALLAGQKTSVGRVNRDWQNQTSFTTIAELAMQMDLSAGAVSSVMVSHATPAAVISHNESRNNYVDIFNEMKNSQLSVIMGAGHPYYDNNGNYSTESAEYKFVGGKDTFEQMQSSDEFTYIESKEDFIALSKGNLIAERVIGIARAGSTLQASRETDEVGDNLSGTAFNAQTPDLSTMSLGALNVLSKDSDGFFLMIEGGAVDWMGHANNMPRFIEEQVDFNLAVDAVMEWIDENGGWDNTLLVVTSDHECGGIWGEGTWTNSDGIPVATSRDADALESARFNPEVDTFNQFLAVQDNGKGQLPGFQFSSRFHTNDLVPLWAIGKGAGLFNEYRQNDEMARKLWGDTYRWNGDYVDNTDVFKVMEKVLKTNNAIN